jgi:hypothetical protein
MFGRCNGHCNCNCEQSSGVGWIIFAMVMFAGAFIAFSIAAIAFHIWIFCQIMLRLLDRQWFRAMWWAFVLLFLFYLDGTILLALDAS